MSKDPQVNWVLVGVVARPFGILGGLKVNLFNPSTDNLRKGIRVLLKHPSKEQCETTLQKALPEGRLFFDAIKSRNDAELWRGSEVYFPREDFAKTNEDEIYLVDLIGYKAVSIDGSEIGKIVSFSDNNAQALAEIQTPERIVSVPFVEPLVQEIEHEKKLVVLDLPEGLLEI